MASRAWSLLSFALASAAACGGDERAPNGRALAFSFAGPDLVVVEASTVTKEAPPKGPTIEEYAPDGRVVRYTGAALDAAPTVLVDGLMIGRDVSSQLAIVGDRALVRQYYQFWIFGLADGSGALARTNLPFDQGGTSFVSDGTAVYTDLRETGTSMQEGRRKIARLDGDARGEWLPLSSTGRRFTLDAGSIYLTRGCLSSSRGIACPEAGVWRAAPADVDAVQVARLDSAQTTLDLTARDVAQVSVGGGRIWFTSTATSTGPTCAVHVVMIDADEAAKDVFRSDDEYDPLSGFCMIAAADDGVIACGNRQVVHVDVSGATTKLADTDGCVNLQWRDGLAAWLENRVVRTVRTR